MAFRVGQKVERISGLMLLPSAEPPPMGAICTVVNVYIAGNGWETIELFEYPNPETDIQYAGWRGACFRPVVERKTDISIFEKMLTSKKEHARA